MRMGFVCIPTTITTEDYSESRINEIIIKSMMNLVDKLVIVVPSENMIKKIKWQELMKRDIMRHCKA